MRAATRRREVVTVAGTETFDDVHATLEGCLSSHNHVPASIQLQLGIAVAELVANIVEHASQGKPVRVQMSVEVLANQVHISFTDDGIACSVDPEVAEMPDELAHRGRGVAMMRAVLGSLSYHRSATHNHWRLISRPFG